MKKSKAKATLKLLQRERATAAERQGNCCKYCFEPFTVSLATAEHRVPKCKGGLNFAGNIDAACASCNRLKGAMTAGAFLKAIKSPVGSPSMLLAYARRRIWLQAHRACRNIGRASGVEISNPLTLSEVAQCTPQTTTAPPSLMRRSKSTSAGSTGSQPKGTASESKTWCRTPSRTR